MVRCVVVRAPGLSVLWKQLPEAAPLLAAPVLFCFNNSKGMYPDIVRQPSPAFLEIGVFSGEKATEGGTQATSEGLEEGWWEGGRVGVKHKRCEDNKEYGS